MSVMPDELQETRGRGRRENWHRLVTPKKIGLFLVLLAVAVGGFLLPLADGEPEPTERATRARAALAAAESGGASFLDAGDVERYRVEAQETGRSFWDRFGPWLGRLGVSAAVGLVMGIFFRAFLKWAALVTALLAGGLAALAWFEVVDVTTFQANLDGAGEYARTQASAAKDFAINVLPSTFGALAGFVVGFLRG